MFVFVLVLCFGPKFESHFCFFVVVHTLMIVSHVAQIFRRMLTMGSAILCTTPKPATGTAETAVRTLALYRHTTAVGSTTSPVATRIGMLGSDFMRKFVCVTSCS